MGVVFTEGSYCILLPPHRLTHFRPGEKLDPHNGSGWFVSQRSRSTLCSHPVATLIFNFPPPGSNAQHDSSESLLSINDVTILFSKVLSFIELVDMYYCNIFYRSTQG